MIRLLLSVCLIFVCACSEPPTPDTTVIVGATLIRGSQSPMRNSVIIVKDDRIAAVGSQQMTPIPPASSKLEAYGKYVSGPTGTGEIQAGAAANLVILTDHPGKNPDAKVERRMVAGRWVE